jgi:hypothetical protein
MKSLPPLLLSFSLLTLASSARSQEPPPLPAATPSTPALPASTAGASADPPADVPAAAAAPGPVAPAPAATSSRPPQLSMAEQGSETAPVPESETVPTNPRHDARVEMWRLEMGYRGSFVSSPGFNPFSTNDSLPQFSIIASRTILASGPISFAPGFAWDYGSKGATSRGDSTSLSLHRLTVPLEGRVHIVPWGYALIRVAPGVVAQHAEVDDASSPAPLTKNRWLFATDVSAGYAWLVGPQRGAGHIARLWLQAEGGYGWVAAERLNLAPALASGDSRVVSGIDLGSIAMSGAFFRAAAALSF